MFIIVLSFWRIDPFILKCHSLSLVIPSVLKSFLSDISVPTTALLWLLIAYCIFFIHLFTLNLFVSLNLKCFFCRQHTVGPLSLLVPLEIINFIGSLWGLNWIVGSLNKTLIAGPHLQYFGLSSSDVGLRICISNRYAGDHYDAGLVAKV